MTSLTRPPGARQYPEATGFTSIPNVVHALVESPREFQLVALLISYRWYPTSPIIPSVRTLADRLGCSQRTVRRTAAALEARGLLRRVERIADDQRQMSNEYVLCGPLLTAVAEVEAGRDQGQRQRWPGGRSRETVEVHPGKQHKTNRRNEGGYHRPSLDPESYLKGPLGKYVRT